MNNKKKTVSITQLIAIAQEVLNKHQFNKPNHTLKLNVSTSDKLQGVKLMLVYESEDESSRFLLASSDGSIEVLMLSFELEIVRAKMESKVDNIVIHQPEPIAHG
jgi:hypothetical protein